MTSIIKERQLTQQQQELLELKEIAPEKFNPDHNSNSGFIKKNCEYRNYTQEEVAKLLTASKSTYVNTAADALIEPLEKKYSVLSREAVEQLVQEYLKNRKQ